MTTNPLEIQAKFRELGRIRLGQIVSTDKPGGTRPTTLKTFRLTSADEDLIQSAADMWGGKPNLWEGSPGGSRQWEVVLEKKSIPVLVPPIIEATSLNCEKWAFGLFQWRCDGKNAQQPDKDGDIQFLACNQWCQAKEKDSPKMVFRANFMLPDLQGLGMWRLETGSYNAVRELRPTMQMLMRMGTHNDSAVPAILKMEQRSERKAVKGGKPVTYNYSVPVLDPGIPIGELMQMPGAMSAMALAESEKDTVPVMMLAAGADDRPEVPEIPDAPDAATWPGKDAQPPPALESGWSKADPGLPIKIPVPSAAPSDDHWVATDPATDGDIQQFAIICRTMYGADGDTERHRVAFTVSDERTKSSKELTRGEINKAKGILKGEAMVETIKIGKELFDNTKETFGFLAEQDAELFGDWSAIKGDKLNPSNWAASKWASAVQMLRGKQVVEESPMTRQAMAMGAEVTEVQNVRVEGDEVVEEMPW